MLLGIAKHVSELPVNAGKACIAAGDRNLMAYDKIMPSTSKTTGRHVLESNAQMAGCPVAEVRNDASTILPPKVDTLERRAATRPSSLAT